VEGRVVLPPRLVVRWRLVIAWREFVRRQIPVEGGACRPHPLRGCEEARRPQVDGLGQRPPPSLLPPAGSWAISSSSRRQARSPSFEDDVDWEGLEAELEAETEPAPKQRVLGPEDFIIDDDEAERRAFELVHRLSRVKAEAARQRAALEARTNIALVREYEQWQAKGATRRIKKEIVGLDDE
jgi:hypothetical protein